MKAGDKVTIVGLSNRVDLNGCTGTLLEYMTPINRWSVALPEGRVRAKPNNLVALNAPGADLELYVKVSMKTIETPRLAHVTVENMILPVEKKIQLLTSLANKKSSENTHYFYKFPTLQQMEQLGQNEIVTPMCFAIPDHIVQSAIHFLEKHTTHAKVIHFIGDIGIDGNSFEFESVPVGQWPLQKSVNDRLLSKSPDFDVKKYGARGVAKWSGDNPSGLQIELKYSYFIDDHQDTPFMQL
jgi:hypothetical protein